MPNFLHTTHRTVAWLKQAHDAGTLVIKPPFQRNPVWTDTQKAYLIDTILNEFPVPELYMQHEVDSKGREKQTVVDGQQRVRACLEFLEGRFAMDPEDSPDWGDMKFDDLSPEDQQKIYSYQFVVRVLPVVQEPILRQIFRRLNRNVVALNAQELRHATYWGVFITLMEKLADLPYWEGTGLFTATDVRRMLDVEFVSELTVAYLHGPQNKKANLEKMYKIYEKEFEQATTVEEIFQKTLGELEQVVPNIRQTRWRKKSDFYTLFLVFAKRSVYFPMPSNQRNNVAKVLIKFGKDVDECVKVESRKRKRMAALTVKYASAVERSASDLGSRKAREKALEGVLLNAWRRTRHPNR